MAASQRRERLVWFRVGVVRFPENFHLFQETPLAAALVSAQVPLAVVNPRQVRDFAKASGKPAKTGSIDALVLAHFADAIRPEPRPIKNEEFRALDVLQTNPQATGLGNADSRKKPPPHRAALD
ncbi:MAG: transposase [Magnetococcales bacterium]|nr:transposase [Magnetococcales bacterium]